VPVAAGRLAWRALAGDAVAMSDAISTAPRYRRVLLKMSGEALLGEQSFGHDRRVHAQLAEDVAAVHAMGVEVCLVIGGGNIVRGATFAAAGVERSTADYMGMLGTVINALAVQSVIEQQTGIPTRVMSAIPMSAVCEPYIRRRAIRHLEKGRIVIFAAGTGNPFFTTDTAAALRAAEIGCDALIKATQVDGVYSADPKREPGAIRYDRLSYLDVLSQDLKVMDASAISLARENGIPIIVFSVHAPGNFARVLRGEGAFTIITEEAER
jgi:uridylate kinase